MYKFATLYFLQAGLAQFTTALWAKRIMQSDKCHSVYHYNELQQVHHSAMQEACNEAICLLVAENIC